MFNSLFRNVWKVTRQFSKVKEAEDTFGAFSKQALDAHLELGIGLLRTNKLEEGKRALVKVAEMSEKVLSRNSKEQSDLMNLVGRHLELSGDLETALGMYVKAYEVDKVLKGEDEELLATHANRIGAIFADLGELDKAEEYLSKIFNTIIMSKNDELKAAFFGNYGHVKMRAGDQKNALQYFLMAKEFQLKSSPKDEILIKYIQSIGMCYWVQGDHALAKENFQQALSELKSDPIKNCLELVDIYSHLAYLHNDMKEPEQTFKYFEHALDTYKSSNLENKPEKIREFLKNISEAMKSAGDLKQSKRYLDLYLEYCRQSFGENSRETAEGYQLYSSLFLRQRMFQESLEYAEKCMNLCKGFENNHYDLFQCFNQFAVIMHKIGELEAAEKFLTQSGDILKRFPNERFQVSHFHNLALLYRDQQKFPEAESNMELHLQGVRKQFSELHPATASAYTSLGHIQRASKNLSKSKESYLKAHNIYDQTIGHDHLNTSDVLEFIGEVFRQEKNFIEALKMHNEALNIKLKILGPSHNSLHIPYFNLASTHLEMGEWEKAEKYTLKRMDVLKNAWGHEHVHVAGNLNFLAEVFVAGKEHKKAILALEESVRILKKVGNNEMAEEQEKKLTDLKANFRV